jgi:glutathione synthase
MWNKEGTMVEPSRNPGNTIKTGIVMDPIAGIKSYKDSSFAMLLEAQRRGHELLYMEPGDLTVADGTGRGHMRPLSVRDNTEDWFTLGESRNLELAELDILLMRKDPPFDMDYVYTTYILDLAEKSGVTVVNRPQALRDANEKCFITHFPQCCVPALITRSSAEIKDFVAEHALSVVKPLDGMGGESIFQLRPEDPNLNVILETITSEDRELVMVQKYIPEISQGDKRILVVNGNPIPFALALIPGEGDLGGHLA